jgi:hypothetical protein
MDAWLTPLRGFGAVRKPLGSGFVWDSGWSSGVDIDFGNGIGICNDERSESSKLALRSEPRARLRTGTAGSGGNGVFFFCFFNGLGSSLGGEHS